MSEKFRNCSKCDLTFPISYFPIMVHHKNCEKPIRRSHCKLCDCKLNKQRVKFKKQYGSPPDNYFCPICERDFKQLTEQTRFKSIWSIDHDHKTGEFRGWLCHPCNRGIGMLGDDINKLERAKIWLSKK